MIKSFTQFVNEKEETDSLGEDAKVSSVIQDIDRNYNSHASISASHLSEILVLEEIRDWQNFTGRAKLDQEVQEPCKYYIKYEKAPETFEVQIDFDLSFKGVDNYDVAEPGYDYDREPRLGISLEKIRVKKVMVKSDTVSYSSSSFSKDLGKTVLRFLLNMFKPQFDMIGDEALIIRQL